MAFWLPFLAAASTAVSAYGSYKAGKDADEASRDAARNQEWNAGKTMEGAMMRANEQKRATARMLSDAQAIQAGSGFSASDPTSLRRVAELSGEGKYNELAILYEGTAQAEAIRRDAKLTRQEGRAQRTSGYLRAGSTVLGGFGSGGSFTNFAKSF